MMAAPLFWALLLSLVWLCFARHPTHPYETEPTFRPEEFKIRNITNDTSQLAPGYVFIAPLANNGSWGPQIYDIYGNLIYCGGNIRVQDFKVCDWRGRTGRHLCWHRSRFEGPEIDAIHNPIYPSRPPGKKLVFDKTYRLIPHNFTEGIREGDFMMKMNWPNGHEYNMLPGGESFIQVVYRPLPMDLSEYGGRVHGWVRDGCFQERGTLIGKAIFTWCYLDHLPIWESNLFFQSKNQFTNVTSSKAGRGRRKTPWDFMHINAVDKTPEGDYLVSGRHLDQIIKVAGRHNVHGVYPGSVLWRLGGKSNDFEMLNNFTFSKQHDVRLISTNGSETTFTILNNAWDGTTEPSAPRSSGMIITIDNSTMQARLVREYPHPENGLARAMGSVQSLPNGNKFVGWGGLPQLTEFSDSGAVLYHTEFFLDNLTENENGQWTYRAYKFPWVGRPHWNPRVLGYKRMCGTSDRYPLFAYASWNGATEIESWHFALAADKHGPWKLVAIADKQEFETKVLLSSTTLNPQFRSMTWIKAVALDKNKKKLGQVKDRIFVPRSSVLDQCDRDGCRNNDKDFSYSREKSCLWLCKSPVILNILLVLVIFFIEGIVFLGQTTCDLAINLERPPRSIHDWRRVVGSTANAILKNKRHSHEVTAHRHFRDASHDSKLSWE